MGWFFVNILLPICIPPAFLLLAKLVTLPTVVASRTMLIRTVKDGQLGWVALVFASSCTYDLYTARTQAQTGSPLWLDLVFALTIILLGFSGFLATLGTLYPVEDPIAPIAKVKDWIYHYRLFVGTAIATFITASLFSLVHYTV